MPRTRGRKIWRDIWARKGRTALVSISIFIGVLGVVTLTSVSDLLIHKLRSDLDEDSLSMIDVYILPEDDVDEETIDRDGVLDMLREYPGVTVVQGWARDRVFWRSPDDTGFIEGSLRAFSEPFDQTPLEPVTLVEGHFPVAGEQQVAIERRMASRYGLKVGDPIVIRILSDLEGSPEFAVDVPEEIWTISGIVFHPYVGNPNISVYATFEDLSYITGTYLYDQVMVRFSDFALADAQADKIENLVGAGRTYDVDWINVQDPAQNQIIVEMQDWANTLTALAVIAMLVSCFLVVTVITTIMIEQRNQVGIMKSLGATRWDNMVMYAGLSVFYGVIGVIPGVLLGVPAGYAVTLKLAPLINVLFEDFAISYTAVAVGAAMGILMPLLASLLPVFFGTRVSILQAITDFGISARFGRGRIARLIGRLPLPVSMRQALANIYQKRGRLALTGLTLTLAAGAFMGVSALFMSLNTVVNDIFDTFNFQLVIVPVSPDDYDYDEVGALIEENVEGLAALYPAYSLDVDILLQGNPGGEDTQFMWVNGFDPADDSIKLKMKEGHSLAEETNPNAVVISEMLADAIGKGVGETITVRHDYQLLDMEIVGVARLPFENGFASWETMAQLAGKDAPREYWLRFEDDDLSAGDVDRQIAAVRETLLRHGIITYFQNQRAFEEENAEIILTVGVVFNIASAVMAAVGAIGLLTMLSISVYERQREIGVMRSVGASSYVILRQFLVEGLTVGLIAWGIGVPLSYGLAQLLREMLPIGEIAFDYPEIALILGLGGMLVVATLASLWPSLAASRKTVSDILRYQ